MSDVLTITVPTPVYNGRERYASMNVVGSGWGAGKKPPEYVDLFRAVREAARLEMARTGWQTWDRPCAVEVVRYHRTLTMTDCTNLGKVEADALAPSDEHQEKRDGCEPFPGVYANDRLARPYHADVEYDPEGPDRILVIVRRRFADPTAVAPKARRSKPPGRAQGATVVHESPITATSARTVVIRSLDEIPSGTVITDFAERDRILEGANVRPAPPKSHRTERNP